MPDLTSEWLSFAHVTTADRRQLGLDRHTALTGDAQIAKTRARIDHGLFVPDADGVAMFVVPVFDWPALHGGGIVDFVAWEPEQPDHWFLRHGWAEALGVWHSFGGAEPVDVRVHRRPLDWLRADGNGICLLATDPLQQGAILRMLHAIVAEDMAHRDQIARVMRKPFELPRVTVAPARRAA